MSGLMEELLSVLEEQAENYSNLLGLSQEKKEVIIKNDLEYLQKITALENGIVSKNQKLEKKRMQLMQDIAMVLNRTLESLTLGGLAELYKNKPEYDRIMKLRDTIKNSITELKEVNEQNKLLIQNSLDYIEFSMNIIRSSLSKTPAFYTSSGEQMNSGDPFFDAKQ